MHGRYYYLTSCGTLFIFSGYRNICLTRGDSLHPAASGDGCHCYVRGRPTHPFVDGSDGKDGSIKGTAITYHKVQCALIKTH